MLLRAGNTLSARGLARLEATFRSDDPTDEISAVWTVKEQLRRLLRAGNLADANHQRLLLTHYVQVAATPETTRLLATVNTWWDAIEVLVVTGVTNARTQAANTSIKQLKRTGRGYRKLRPLPGSYPPGQCRPKRGMNTHLSARHHANYEEPVHRRAAGRQPAGPARERRGCSWCSSRLRKRWLTTRGAGGMRPPAALRHGSPDVLPLRQLHGPS